MRRLLPLIAAALCLVTSALAQAGIRIEAQPVFGAQAAPAYGWTELVVRIENDDAQPQRGTIEFAATGEGDVQVRAPFAVGPGSSAIVLLPVYGNGYRFSQNVRAIDEAGQTLAAYSLPYAPRPGHLLIDLIAGSKLPIALQSATVSASSENGMGSAQPQVLTVGQPKWNPATGDPILPLRAAAYASAAAVLITSDQLVKLAGPELEALNGYVLGGGNLGIVVRRPEDLRHANLQQLVGGEVVSAQPPKELWLSPEDHFDPLPPDPKRRPGHPPTPQPETAEQPAPETLTPSPELAKTFVGHAGGKLRPSPFGASATYGLGEVHLLAFDPTHPAALEDPWTYSRVVDLARHGLDLHAPIVFSGSAFPYEPSVDAVHRRLDPNENARFAILFVGIALLVYAIVAGPVNFSRAAKKGRPLRALLVLPLLSAGTFVAIVVFGVFAKGLQGRARHLTLIEAGAGEERAVAHRFRGFFVASGTELSVRTTDAASVIRRSRTAPDESEQTLFVDRDGSRLVDMQTQPWETLVVRENGFASLGSGISILPTEGGGDATIVNRTGRDLRGVIVHVPGRALTYFSRIGDGESVLASSGRPAPISTVTGVGAFEASAMNDLLNPDARGLGEAWVALLGAAAKNVDWFPFAQPAVLAQLDGGEGTTSDSSLRLESDRALVRVLGWGGTP